MTSERVRNLVKRLLVIIRTGLLVGAMCLCSVAVALILGELYVRVFSRYGYWTPASLTPDEDKFNLPYVPGVFSRINIDQRERSVRYYPGIVARNDTLTLETVRWYINKKGYRGKDFSIEKPPGTVRIMIYGGSQVFDPIADPGNDFPRLLEKKLHARGFPSVEVINAGTPGTMAAESFGRLFAEGHHFQPDYVVLCNGWNDTKLFSTTKPLLRQVKPFAIWRDPFFSYLGPVDRFLGERSQLYVRLRRRYFVWKRRKAVEDMRPVPRPRTMLSATALRQHRLNVDMFVKCALTIGATPVLMTQPRLVAPDNTDAMKDRIKYVWDQITFETLCKAFEFTDEVSKQTAVKYNLSLLDASAGMTGIDSLFADHVHLSPAGSEALSALLADHFEKSLALRKPGRQFRDTLAEKFARSYAVK